MYREDYRKRGNKIISNNCEVNIAQHCNLSCRACSHLSPLHPPLLVDPDRLYADLATLAAVYEVDQVCLLGGEPLLHPELPSLADAVRSSGISRRVRVITNGLLLPRVPTALWKAVNEIRISQYPGYELDRETLVRCFDMAQDFGVDLTVRYYDRFQESYSEIGTDNRGLVQRIYQTCQMAHVWHCHAVANGKFYKCSQSISLLRFVADSRTQSDGDGLVIDEPVSLFAKLLEYLKSHHPLAACRWCLGSVGRLIPPEQIKRTTWRQAQCKKTEELIDEEMLAKLEAADGPPSYNICVSKKQYSDNTPTWIREQTQIGDR